MTRSKAAVLEADRVWARTNYKEVPCSGSVFLNHSVGALVRLLLKQRSLADVIMPLSARGYRERCGNGRHLRKTRRTGLNRRSSDQPMGMRGLDTPGHAGVGTITEGLFGLIVPLLTDRFWLSADIHFEPLNRWLRGHCLGGCVFFATAA